MLITYSQTDGLAKAARDTFSGERPCELCCKIEETRRETSKNSGKETPDLPSVTKLRHDLLPAAEIVVKSPAGTDRDVVRLLPPLPTPGIGQQPPPVPPPRMVAWNA